MKILLINNGYPSKYQPKYCGYIQTISECLEEAGAEVDMLVMEADFNSQIGKVYCYAIYYFRLLIRKYTDYDLVYINNYPYSALMLGPHFNKMKNVVIHWHGDELVSKKTFSKMLRYMSLVFIRPHFFHFAPSNYFKRKVTKVLAGKCEQVVVTPSGGIDLKMFCPATYNTHKDRLIRLGFASGLSASKGMEAISYILTKFDNNIENYDIEFHYIEYGSERNTWRFCLEKLQNIELKKYPEQPKDAMPLFYNAIDILLFPTIREGNHLAL